MGRHQWLDSSSWPFKGIIAKSRNWSLQQGKAYGQGPSLELSWHLVCEHTRGPRNEWGPLPRELNDNPWVHVSALLWEFCRDCLILCIWPNVFRYGVHLALRALDSLDQSPGESLEPLIFSLPHPFTSFSFLRVHSTCYISGSVCPFHTVTPSGCGSTENLTDRQTSVHLFQSCWYFSSGSGYKFSFKLDYVK